ncbi:DUF418 domain-containing protein [Anaerophaga thermohalophila]
MNASLNYGLGPGLYQYTGATFSLLIGLALSILKTLFSQWWFKSHKLELE